MDGLGNDSRARCSSRTTSVSALIARAAGPSRTISSTSSRALRTCAAARNGTSPTMTRVHAHACQRLGIETSFNGDERTDDRRAADQGSSRGGYGWGAGGALALDRWAVDARIVKTKE